MVSDVHEPWAGGAAGGLGLAADEPALAKAEFGDELRRHVGIHRLRRVALGGAAEEAVALGVHFQDAFGGRARPTGAAGSGWCCGSPPPSRLLRWGAGR